MRTATIITMSAILLAAVGCHHDSEIVVYEHYDVHPPVPRVHPEIYTEHINSPQFVNTRVVVDVIERDEPEMAVLLNVVDDRLAAISVEFEQARYDRRHDAQFTFAIMDAEYELLYRLYHHIDRYYNHRRHRYNTHLRRRLGEARNRIDSLRRRNRRLRRKFADERDEADRLARQNKRLKKKVERKVARFPHQPKPTVRRLPPRGNTPPPEVITSRHQSRRGDRTVTRRIETPVRTTETRNGPRTRNRTRPQVVRSAQKNRIRREKPKKGGDRPIIARKTETKTFTRPKPSPKAVARVQKRTELKQARIGKTAQVKQTRQTRRLATTQARETKQLSARQQKTQRVATNQTRRTAVRETRQARRVTAAQTRETKKLAARETRETKQAAARERKADRTRAAKARKQEKQSKREARRTRIAANLD